MAIASLEPSSDASVAGGARKLTIAGEERVVERASARKASVALGIMRALSKAVPDLNKRMAEFRRTYAKENAQELDRVQARLEFPDVVLRNAEGEAVMDDAGAPVTVASPVSKMTDEDWDKAGGILRLPLEPTQQEVIMAILDYALETAEDHVYRLLALFLIPNRDVKTWRRDGSLPDKIEEVANDVLDDAMADELMELAVVAGEVVGDQFRSKAASLGERLGNSMRLIGMDPAAFKKAMAAQRAAATPAPITEDPSPSEPSSDGPTSSTPSSSIDSPEPMADSPATPSTSPSTSSTSSATSSGSTSSEPESSGP